MTAAPFFDDLIRDYLLFRGFTSTLKAYEAELKSDKDKGFRVDKIVDQLCSYVASYDLTALRETWGHLDQRVFSRLEHQFNPTVRKLENGILKMYVVNAVQTNRNDKLLEFFENTSSDLQSQADWKDWFVLPFTKNPEENPAFSMYFTRQWQDTILVSLHNFLSVIFQSMPLPTLLSFEEEQVKISQLIDENELLKKKLEEFEGKENVQDLYSADVISATTELMDDFYVIAQEAPPTDRENKTIRSFIRNISSGLPTSPILGRKQSTLQPRGAVKKRIGEDSTSGIQGKYMINPGKQRTVSVPSLSGSTAPSRAHSKSTECDGKRTGGGLAGKIESQRFSSSQRVVDSGAGSSSLNASQVRTSQHGSSGTSAEGCESKCPFLLLSQEVYSEHHSAITHCKFNASGSVVASSDVDGIIKIWAPSPSPQTLATVISKSSSVLALEWANRLERLLLLGNKAGTIRLYDTKEKKTLCEVGMESGMPFREQSITCLACNPSETSFICCAMGKPRVALVPGAEFVPEAVPEGRITIWDMKVMMLQKTLNLQPSSAVVNGCVFNHNGQLLLVVAADGRIRLFDMRNHERIATWQGHEGSAYSVQFSPDETSCYSLGEDGKFVQWSVNKTGQKIFSASLHDGAVGPFALPTGVSKHYPVGKLFTSDAEGKHILTCSPGGGLIYSLSPNEVPQLLVSLGGHKSSVVTVDWATTTTDMGICTTASSDGAIQVSTLLSQ